MTEPTPRMFKYLLNAMEDAAQTQNPFEHGYSEKRSAVFQHVESLERALARRDALLREISREISWDEKVGDYWKRRIERELEKK
jgi:uncharacterized protein Yka (UPF0111/DUF47 family)